MCLQAQDIDDEYRGIGRGRQVRGLRDYGRVVGRRRGIENASEGLEMTTKAAMIRGQQRRLQSRNDGPEELATTTEASIEKDNPEDSTTTAEALAEEAEETTRLRERLRRRIWKCVYGPRELTTAMVASTEEEGTKDSAMTTEASEGDKE